MGRKLPFRIGHSHNRPTTGYNNKIPEWIMTPPGYEGEVPEGYFTAKSTSGVNWIILRGFLKDGKPDFSSKLFREGLKIHPLAKAANPPAMEFINGSKKAFNTIHSTGFHFYEELHAVIDREPIEMIEPQLRGLFASIGIQKGKPFAPDARMKKVLTRSLSENSDRSEGKTG